jgi:membrane-associated protease RseP (regulator of RpoE activity)
VSVLLHELGHAVAFRAFGHRPSIEMYGMGGLTRGGGGPPLGTSANVIVALAGPGVGLAFGAAVFAFERLVGLGQPLLWVAVRDLLWVNIGWGLLNMLPMLPLDGGLVMLALARRLRGHHRGDVLADQISLAVAAAVALAAITYQMTWAALLAAWFGSESFLRLRQRDLATRHSDGP